MTLLDSLFRRDAGARPVGAGAGEMTGEQAQEARVRARRRLIGAVVLLGIGVIAFPLLFETQPRPIPVDIPIVIPPRDGAPPLALPAPRAGKPAASAAPVAAAPSADAVVAAAPATAPAPAATPVPAPAPSAVAPAAPVPAPPKAETPAAKPEPAKPPPRPTPKPEAEAPKPVAVPAAAAPAASGRFVVQIGAFAEASAVRETRAKAQKAGVTTYTQVVDTSGGKRTRVRVGPFNSREDAEKAAEKIKAAGLAGSVMPL